MAANSNTASDEDGDFSDWIEIYNSSANAVNLAGYTLSDDANTLDKWVLPNQLLDTDQYLVLFASGKDRRAIDSELHTNFKLSAGGEYLALTRPDGTIATEFAPQYPALGEDLSYGSDQNGQTGILATPSPGSPNDFLAAATITISPSSRAFENFIQVELNSQIDGALIRYTTDGSSPTSSSPQYNGPLIFSNRTKLSAQAFYPDGSTSQIETQRYIKLQNDVANFASDLPLILIDTFDQAVDQENKTPIFAQVIDVGSNGQAAMTDAPQLATYAGLTIRGALSAIWDKKQYALETWSEDQTEIDTSPLGLPAESDWILNGPYADKTLMKNVLVYDWWNEMGRYASRSRFVEVYLNADNSTISADDYIGVYVLLERIKRDGDRVDIEKLTPADTTAPNVNGGYIWKVDDPNTEDLGFQSSQGNPNCLLYFNVYPRYENSTPEQQSAMRGFVDQYDDALFGTNFADPVDGYAKYIDVDSFIDYGIMQDFTQNTDGYHRSIFFHKPRAGKVTMGPIWDFNFSLGVDNKGLGAPDQPLTDREGGSCWQTTFPRLFQDPAFELKYWDRWFELRETVFAEAKLMAEIDANASRLNQAQARNFQRWDILNEDIRDVTLPGTYAGAITLLKDWVSDRIEWFDSRWVNPPLFNQEGGDAAPGFQLTMSPPPNIAGVIYYTLNGEDPRALDGNIAANALQYDGPITLTGSRRVMARVKVNTGWSALNDDIFHVDPSANSDNLAVTEIQYHPHQPTTAEQAAGYTDADSFEFIELQNVSTSAIDIHRVRLADAVSFDFSTSDYLILQPNERVIVVENVYAFALRYGSNLPVAGEYSGKLSNSEEQITLLDPQENVIEQIQYDSGNGWPGRADGRGSSLVRNNVSADGNMPDNWRASRRYGGTPGEAAESTGNTVVINEILAHSDPPLTDAIELYNDTAASIDISNWYLSDSGNLYKKYRIPAGSILEASGFSYFDESDFNNPDNPDNLEPFALSSAKGDSLYLIEADEAGNLIRFVDKVSFGATATGESIGLWPNGAEQFYPMQSRTLGESNFSAGNRVRVGSIVISEIHYNPDNGDTNLEYIELYNAGASSQLLDNWRLRGEVDFDFPSGITLAAKEALIVVGFDPANGAIADNFRNSLYDFGNSRMLGPWTNNGQIGVQLGNDGGTIKLQRPDELEIPTDGSATFYPMIEEDTVRYDDDGRWPTLPDAGGPALERINVTVYGDTPTNWQPSALSGGTPGVLLLPAVLVNVPAEGLITTEAGGADTVEIVLQSPPRAAVTIPLNVSNSGEGSISPAELIFSIGNWDQPQTVTVVGVDDLLVDGDAIYTVRIEPAISLDDSYDGIDAADVAAINKDNDQTILTPTQTPIQTPTQRSTSTPTSIPTNTSTAIPTIAPTYTPRSTNTPVPVVTNTSVPLPTTPPPTDPVPTNTVDPNIEITLTPATSTLTPIAQLTNTPVPVATNTSVPLATNTPTNTPVPSATATATNSPTIVPTPPPGEITINAELIDANALISWLFTADRKTLWFRIYRAQTPDFNSAEEITPSFIQANYSGTKPYEFSDPVVTGSDIYYYWVEQLYASGNSDLHGPTTLFVAGSGSDEHSIYLPLIKSN